jgi:hypothetical protein
MMPGN